MCLWATSSVSPNIRLHDPIGLSLCYENVADAYPAMMPPRRHLLCEHSQIHAQKKAIVWIPQSM
jgi:hypothetical protein